MMRFEIVDVCPPGQPSLRASLVFFFDHGYLELAKHQTGTVTNLIQIMQDRGVKFLGTIKSSNVFPFKFVEVNENGKQVNNENSVVHTFGTRANFFSRS